MASGQSRDRRQDNEPSCESSAPDGSDSRDSTETAGGKPGKSSLTGRAYSPCTCNHIDHFATFPEELARRCIAAGTSERGCCPECGAPWVREVERGAELEQRPSWSGEGNAYGVRGGNHRGRTGNWGAERETLGWHPSCACGLDVPKTHEWEPLRPVACTVLDPFVGSGTVPFVARKLGRRAVGIDLNADYLALADERLRQQSLFAQEAT